MASKCSYVYVLGLSWGQMLGRVGASRVGKWAQSTMLFTVRDGRYVAVDMAQSQSQEKGLETSSQSQV